jgi:hypothetical protein
MAKRFSDLKKALKYIQSTTWTPGDPISNAPSNSALGNFQAWLSGNNREVGTRDAQSKTGGFEKVSINPFAYQLDPDGEILIPISKRALERDSISAVRVASNVVTSPAPSAKAPPRGFIPAKAIVFIPSVQSDVKSTSNITGLKYNGKEGTSYTIPMGQATSEIYESQVQGLVRDAVDALPDLVLPATVTFKSEQWR